MNRIRSGCSCRPMCRMSRVVTNFAMFIVWNPLLNFQQCLLWCCSVNNSGGFPFQSILLHENSTNKKFLFNYETLLIRSVLSAALSIYFGSREDQNSLFERLGRVTRTFMKLPCITITINLAWSKEKIIADQTHWLYA